MTDAEYKQLESTPITPAERNILYGGWNSYIATPNSFEINNYLRGLPLQSKSSIEPEDLKTINLLTGVIRRGKTVPKNLNAMRKVRLADLESITGQKVDKYDIDQAFQDLQTTQGKSFTENGFTSVSLKKDKNVFKSRNVELEIQVPKGKKWYFTDNNMESEAIFEPGQTFTIRNVERTSSNSIDSLKIVVSLSKKP